MSGLRNKYPISNWVLSQSCLEIGDTIAYWDDKCNEEIHARVIELPKIQPQNVVCIQIDRYITETINFYNVVTYKISSASTNGKCTCGAKHTSNPNYHLKYCDVKN